MIKFSLKIIVSFTFILLFVFLSLNIVSANSLPIGGGVKIFYLNSNSILISGGKPINSYNSYSPSYLATSKTIGGKYYNRNWLTTSSCNPSIIGNKIFANFAIGTSGNKYDVVNFLNSYQGSPNGKQILNKNLWMSSDVKYELVKQGGVQNVPLPTKVKILITDTGGVKFSNPNQAYTIQSPWDQAYLQNLGTLNPGTYNVRVTVTPTDSKCDFIPSNNKLEINPRSNPNLKTFTVFKDADNDGWDDIGSLGSGHDLCVGIKGDINDKYQGCPTEYTKISCTKSMSFDGTNIKFSNHFFNRINYLSKDGIISKKFTGFKTLVHKPAEKSGIYSGEYFNWFFWKNDGYCKLRYNAKSSCTLPNSGEVLTQGVSKNFYKFKTILPGEVSSGFESIQCTGSNSYDNPTFISNGFQYSNPKILGPEYNDIKRNNDGSFSTNDNSNQGKISCPTNSLNCKIKLNGILTPVDLTRIGDNTIKNIKIYKQGILDRTQAVDSKLIALKTHKIKKFKSANSAKKYINKSVKLMEKFNIVKDLNYDSQTGITNVKISTANYSTNSKIQNLTIYQVIDKSIAANFNNINFISDGGGQRFVLDKDPIIGWYFNDTSGNTTIEYNISGNNEGGTIIISQEPILFNEGELIINYREGQTGCNQNEVHLFDLSDLENSKILAKNTGIYQICITNLDSNINLLEGGINNYLNISYYNLNGNISSNFNQLSNKLQLNVVNNNIYWDLRYGEQNPNGNFSCLGSYDITPTPSNLQSSNPTPHTSLFGDCGFKPQNRIWLHLGSDYLAPNTSLKIPFLSHTSKAKLIANDNIGGSGVENTYYCIVEGNNLCQNNINFKKYILDSDIILSCPSDWGCTKTIKYFSTDFAKNNETFKTENVYLIDKGSACQADCTAKPAPNRYLKECRNLNGCSYAKTPGEIGVNIGLNVAKSCNFLTENSYVKFNSTHDIKCPIGPFKLARFSSIPLQMSASNCNNLIKTPYPVLYDGQNIIMNVVSCFDKQI